MRAVDWKSGAGYESQGPDNPNTRYHLLVSWYKPENIMHEWSKTWGEFKTKVIMNMFPLSIKMLAESDLFYQDYQIYWVFNREGF